jgi:hypothetical protein
MKDYKSTRDDNNSKAATTEGFTMELEIKFKSTLAWA